ANEAANRVEGHALRLNSREWDETMQKLASMFNHPSAPQGFGVRRDVASFESADMSAHSKNAAAGDCETIPLGEISPLRDDETSYYATAVVEKTKDRLRLATVTWHKERLESWLAGA